MSSGSTPSPSPSPSPSRYLHFVTASLLSISLTLAIAATSTTTNNVNANSIDTVSLFNSNNETNQIIAGEKVITTTTTATFSPITPASPSSFAALLFLLSSTSTLSILSFISISCFLIFSLLNYFIPSSSSSTTLSPIDGCDVKTERRFLTPPVITEDIKRRASTYPNPYPCGWYKLCYMEDMVEEETTTAAANGEKKYKPFRIMALTKDFTITRTVPSSKVFWSSSSSSAPFSSSPVFITDSTGSPYHAALRLGGVHVWFGREGQHGNLECKPEWELDMSEYYSNFFDSSKYRFLYPCESTFGMYINELSANSPDYAHFNVLHAYLPLPLLGPILQLRHSCLAETATERSAPQQYFFFTERVKFYLFARWEIPLGIFGRTSAHVQFEGPGVVHFEFKTAFGSIHQVKTITPVGPLNQLICDQWYCSKWVPRPLAAAYVWAAQIALEQDRTVWENKVYKAKVILSSADGPFGAFRRWHKRFC